MPPTTDELVWVLTWDWVQSPLGATFVGGLAVLLVGSVVSAIIARAKRIKFREFWARIGRWIRDCWPVTTGRHRREVATALQSGMDTERANIAAERARVPQPAWYVDSSRFDDPDRLLLFNSGSKVWDVSVAADPDYLVLQGEVFFGGPFGSGEAVGGTGKHFGATATEKGKAEGAIVHVKWFDENRDAHGRDVHVPASVFLRGQDAALERRFQEGRRVGRAEVLEESEARRRQFTEEVRWNLIRLAGSGVSAVLIAQQPEQAFRLRNSAAGSTALNVKVEASSQHFQFSEGGQWAQVSPKNYVDFKGIATNGAGYTGVDFSVTWIDESGEAFSAEYHVDGWESGVY